MDWALARLAGALLLTFSVDGSSVNAHRLVTRVIREQLAAGNSLMTACAAGAKLLEGVAASLNETWHQDRAVVRDLIEQVMALYESSAGCLADDALVRVIRLRCWAASFLNLLRDNPARSILIAEPLLADLEHVLDADHPSTRGTRNNLAIAYQMAGRTAEAITMFEQTLADQERVLGVDHPDTLRTRNNLANAYQADTDRMIIRGGMITLISAIAGFSLSSHHRSFLLVVMAGIALFGLLDVRYRRTQFLHASRANKVEQVIAPSTDSGRTIP